MVYRVTITERTMERLTNWAFEHNRTVNTKGRTSGFALTVDDIVCELLQKEGF